MAFAIKKYYIHYHKMSRGLITNSPVLIDKVTNSAVLIDNDNRKG
jgi:hypothetical protein